MGFAEFIIGPAHRVRPPAGPVRTRWLNPSYEPCHLTENGSA